MDTSLNAKVKQTLQQGQKFFIEETNGNWTKITYDSKDYLSDYPPETKDDYSKRYIAGWISTELISYEKIEELSSYKRQSILDDKRRKNYIQKNSKISNSFKNAISIGSVEFGMTEDMVRASIGSPNVVNVSSGSWGVHKQYVYDRKYVYFEDGKLTSVQY